MRRLDELKKQAAVCHGCCGNDWPIGCEMCELRYQKELWENAAYDLRALLPGGTADPPSLLRARNREDRREG